MHSDHTNESNVSHVNVDIQYSDVVKNSVMQTTNTDIVRNKQSNTESCNNSEKEDGFTGVQRKRDRISRFFVSGISESVKDTQILMYLKNRSVHVTHLKLFPSKRKGTLSAKLNIHSKDFKIIRAEDFWPSYVKCRPWIPISKFNKEI